MKSDLIAFILMSVRCVESLGGSNDPTVEGKIVLGSPVSVAPKWMVYQRQTGSDLYDLKCGATMIGPNYILTAARKDSVTISRQIQISSLQTVTRNWQPTLSD